MLASNENKYGLYLTPEETQNSELMRQLELQQHAQLEQAKLRYHAGWHDARTMYAPIGNIEQDLNKVLWNIGLIQWPKIKPQYVLLGVSIALVTLAIILKVVL